MNPHEYAAWTHSLTPDVVGDTVLLTIGEVRGWYPIETIIYDRDGVSLVVRLTDELDAVKSYEEPSLIHLCHVEDKDED